MKSRIIQKKAQIIELLRLSSAEEDIRLFWQALQEKVLFKLI
jgi:hypothetical protein